jgi:hypothetical protein
LATCRAPDTSKLSVSAAKKRERKRLRTQRRLEETLRLLDKPVAERVFPDVEAAKARFREQLTVVNDPEAYRTTYRGIAICRGEVGN